MTEKLTRQMNLPKNAPVCLVLDRSASMATRDCPGGLTRWAYATKHLKAAIGQLIDEGHPCTLLTYGRDVETHERIQPEQLDHLLWGDPASCVGQAVAEALYYAPRILGGGIVVISDGFSDQDTKVGAVLLNDRQAFGVLFERVYFLTVGAVDGDLRAFSELWRNTARLEELCEPAELKPIIPESELNVVAKAMPTEELEQADTIPPPATEAQRGLRGRKR
jgi:hypothetical protein